MILVHCLKWSPKLKIKKTFKWLWPIELFFFWSHNKEIWTVKVLFLCHILLNGTADLGSTSHRSMKVVQVTGTQRSKSSSHGPFLIFLLSSLNFLIWSQQDLYFFLCLNSFWKFYNFNSEVAFLNKGEHPFWLPLYNTVE